MLVGLSALCLTILAIGCAQNAVAQESQPSPLHCVDSNGNGIIDISELFDVIDAYFDSSPITHPGKTPTPTQTPTPTLGSRDNPVPLGTAFEVANSETDHWEVTVLETTPNATDLVLAEDSFFSDPPEEGNQFFIANVRAKYLGTDSTKFGGRYRLEALGDGGVVYTIPANSCGIIPNSLPNPELFTNGTIEGNVCWQIASADVDSLLMLLDEASYSSDPNRYWFSLHD